jgi:RNA polymerase sigma factor (sigma-70 family)
MTNEELANIIENDPSAYKTFYIEYFKKLFNYGRKFTLDNAHIEDAIQEVFLDLWAKKHKLKHINSVNSYLFSSFRYILFKKLKTESKIVNSEAFDAEPEFSVAYVRQITPGIYNSI